MPARSRAVSRSSSKSSNIQVVERCSQDAKTNLFTRVANTSVNHARHQRLVTIAPSSRGRLAPSACRRRLKSTPWRRVKIDPRRWWLAAAGPGGQNSDAAPGSEFTCR